MSKILDITIEYEPSNECETLFNLKTGDWQRIPLNLWRGRIMIGSQQCETYGSNMIFDIRNKLEPKDVLTAQLALLETMRDDIDFAINNIKKNYGAMTDEEIIRELEGQVVWWTKRTEEHKAMMEDALRQKQKCERLLSIMKNAQKEET